MSKRPITLKKVTASLSLNFNIKSWKIMPKATSKRSKPKQEEPSSPELSEDDVPIRSEEKSANLRPGNKRSYNSIDRSGGGDCIPFSTNANNVEYGNDFRKMLDTIGTDFNKSRQAKKQRLEQYTAGAMKINHTKMKEMMQSQEESRKLLNEELQKNVNNVLEQWDVDLSRCKDQEEKMLKIIQQQMKMIQQNRTAQMQRLASIRQIHESYQKSYSELETKQTEQCNVAQLELRRELNELQKKLMEETQKEEMAQMQKYFQSMIFM